MKITASPWFRALSAAVAGAMPHLMVALPQYGWLWTLLAVVAGGTAIGKAES